MPFTSPPPYSKTQSLSSSGVRGASMLQPPSSQERFVPRKFRRDVIGKPSIKIFWVGGPLGKHKLQGACLVRSLLGLEPVSRQTSMVTPPNMSPPKVAHPPARHSVETLMAPHRPMSTKVGCHVVPHPRTAESLGKLGTRGRQDIMICIAEWRYPPRPWLLTK